MTKSPILEPIEKKIEEILGNFYDDAVENCMRCNEERLYNPVVTFVPKFKKAVKDLSSLLNLPSPIVSDKLEVKK